MRIAIYQSALAGLMPADRLEHLARTVQETDAELILCPELFLSGYAVGEELRRLAEPADGPSAARISGLARMNRKAIVYGFPEASKEALYNSALAFGADGALMAHHRKLAIPPGFERTYFTPGTGLTIFTLGEIKLGLLICYDAEFPEAVRATAEAGAHVLLVPTALGAQWPIVAERVIPARAFENGLYVAYANHAGTEGDVTFLGGSCICGPDGRDLARAGAAGTVISATIEAIAVERARNRLPYFQDLAALRPRLQGR
ncbi:MAG: carbon-nitrogen hydrolase family protein [Hyphomicrobiaceae bacterium]